MNDLFLAKLRQSALAVRLFSSAAAAFFVIVHKYRATFFTFIFTPEFYKAMIGTTLVAFALFSLIRYSTFSLDERMDWVKDTEARLIYQIIYGILIPVLLAYPLSALYFWVFRDVYITETDFIEHTYPIVFLIIVCANLYHLKRYFYLAAINGNYWADPKEGDESLRDNFYISSSQQHKIRFDLCEIAFFYREKDVIFFKLMKGEVLVAKENSLNEVQRKLSKELMRVKREYLIHPKAILNCSMKSDKRLVLTLLPHHDEIELSHYYSKKYKMEILKHVKMIKREN